MTQIQCPSCGSIVQEIDDGDENNIQYITDICPSCGYNPLTS